MKKFDKRKIDGLSLKAKNSFGIKFGEIGDISKFSKLVKYAGLDVVISQSGKIESTT